MAIAKVILYGHFILYFKRIWVGSNQKTTIKLSFIILMCDYHLNKKVKCV